MAHKAGTHYALGFAADFSTAPHSSDYVDLRQDRTGTRMRLMRAAKPVESLITQIPRTGAYSPLKLFIGSHEVLRLRPFRRANLLPVDQKRLPILDRHFDQLRLQ